MCTVPSRKYAHIFLRSLGLSGGWAFNLKYTPTRGLKSRLTLGSMTFLYHFNDKNEHKEVDSDSIRCSSDVAGTSRRMVGHTPIYIYIYRAIRYFVSENQGKVHCKIGLGDDFVLGFVLPFLYVGL